MRLCHDPTTSDANGQQPPHFEMFVQIGPVSIVDKLSKDVILQLETSVDSGGEFYIDGSGVELMKRTFTRHSCSCSISMQQPLQDRASWTNCRWL